MAEKLMSMDSMRQKIKAQKEAEKREAEREPEINNGMMNLDLRKGMLPATEEHFERFLAAINAMPEDKVPQDAKALFRKRFQEICMEIARDEFSYGLELGRKGY